MEKQHHYPIKKALAILLIAVIIGTFISLPVYAAALKKGDSGSLVREVQTRLKKWGYYTGTVDGIYGSSTEKAVKSFQKRYGLTADGIVGEATARKIGITLGSTGGSYTSYGEYSSNDVYLMARVVYGEARGESYTGQVAVAAVILNRVKSKQFPNTVSGVVYQANAFTAVADGQINLSPDEEALRAVKDAINGWDPSNGALYYYNPKTATSSWIFTRTVVAVIGNHRFAV